MIEIQTTLLDVASNLNLGRLVQALLTTVFEPNSKVGKVASTILDEKHRPALLKILWVFSVLLLLAISAVVVLGIHAVFGTYKPGIFTAVVLWAVFFGVTALAFLPPKAVVSMFGGLLGIGVSEAASAAGLISKANHEVTKIAIELGAIVHANPNTPDPFIVSLVWTFTGIMTLLCLPAFFVDR
jgi:hypothetical protein